MRKESTRSGHPFFGASLLLAAAMLFAPLAADAAAPYSLPAAARELAAARAQSDAPTEGGAGPRVLLVGDSWTEFMWVNRNVRDMFAAQGRADLVELGGATTISGSTAEDWVTPGNLAEITDALANNPTIDVVQLTIGGNDFLAGQSGGGWFAGIDDVSRDALLAQITGDVGTVIDHILGLDPNIWIVLSLYDYPNFVESRFGLLFFTCDDLWDDLGQPTPREINDAGVLLEDAVDAVVATRPRVLSVRHGGTMQEAFGFSDMGIAPGALPRPGDLDLQSPIESMFLQADCIHLRPSGYDEIVLNLWNGAYRWLYEERMFFDGFETGDAVRWSPGAE
ncbi:MAG: hypothetical protein AAF772_04435 [Acidobacteriota bacterium]